MQGGHMSGRSTDGASRLRPFKRLPHYMRATRTMDSSASSMILLAQRFLVPLLLILSLPLPAAPTPSSCADAERNALLRLKTRLGDAGGRISSWSGPDCCQWSGVTCDNVTGAVVRLELQHRYSFDSQGNIEDDNGKLTGQLDSSLLQLESLTYLDLSDNDLDDVPIPSWLGSSRRLEHLDLSQAGFSGAVPPQLGNLSALRHLDISFPVDGDQPHLHVDSFDWISGLSSLRFLSMSGVDLSRIDSAEIIQTLNDNLPSLAELQLESCRLSAIPQSVPSLKFASLTSLKLSDNDIGPIVPPWIFNITSLVNLYLGGCGFQGLVPAGLGQLSNLDTLILNYNNFSGSLPASIGKLCKLTLLYLESNNLNSELPRILDSSGNSSCGPLASLRELDVSGNRIPGHLPRWLEDLKNLMWFDVGFNLLTGGLPLGLMRLPNMMNIFASNNQLTGELTEEHLSGMKNLITLDLGQNPDLRINPRPDWVPPFQIERLNLGGCRVGPRFPSWIKNQEHLRALYLSDAGISDAVPAWFWGLSPSLQELNLSSNLITGTISEKISAWKGLSSLDLSKNRFSGSIPSAMADMSFKLLDLSNNNLSGQVPHPAIFNSSTLRGNALLCGPPTNVHCPTDHEEGGAATHPSGVNRDPSFYLGTAVGAAAGALITLAIGSYIGRFRQQKKVEGKTLPVYGEDLKKDGERSK